MDDDDVMMMMTDGLTLYLTTLDLQTDAFSLLEDLLHVQLHRKLVDVLRGGDKRTTFTSQVWLFSQLTTRGSGATRGQRRRSDPYFSDRDAEEVMDEGDGGSAASPSGSR